MSNYNPVKSDFDTLKKLLLSDKKTKKAYEDLGDEFQLIAEMLCARKQAKKTQKEVPKTSRA